MRKANHAVVATILCALSISWSGEVWAKTWKVHHNPWFGDYTSIKACVEDEEKVVSGDVCMVMDDAVYTESFRLLKMGPGGRDITVTSGIYGGKRWKMRRPYEWWGNYVPFITVEPDCILRLKRGVIRGNLHHCDIAIHSYGDLYIEDSVIKEFETSCIVNYGTSVIYVSGHDTVHFKDTLFDTLESDFGPTFQFADLESLTIGSCQFKNIQTAKSDAPAIDVAKYSSSIVSEVIIGGNEFSNINRSWFGGPGPQYPALTLHIDHGNCDGAIFIHMNNNTFAGNGRIDDSDPAPYTEVQIDMNYCGANDYAFIYNNIFWGTDEEYSVPLWIPGVTDPLLQYEVVKNDMFPMRWPWNEMGVDNFSELPGFTYCSRNGVKSDYCIYDNSPCRDKGSDYAGSSIQPWEYDMHGQMIGKEWLNDIGADEYVTVVGGCGTVPQSRIASSNTWAFSSAMLPFFAAMVAIGICRRLNRSGWH